MAHERGLPELRQDAEQARAGFTQAVDELRARASPAGLVDRLARSVRDNPLQAVALGAGVAYPLFSVCRAVPGPLLLIGAGLFLSSTSAGQSASRKANDLSADIADKVTRLAADATKTATEQANALASARDGALAAGKTVSSSLDAVKEKASGLADASADQARRVASAAGAAIGGNPVLIGGVGLAIGAFLASALPSSAVEDQWVGGASDRVKSSAREAASESLDAAKDAAQAAFRSAAERAEQEGLTPDEMKATVEDFAQRARKIMSDAIDAAARSPGEETH